MHFVRLCQTEYEHLAKGADILEADVHGPKVLRLTNGLFLKLFRRKRLLSSALWRPYSRCFVDNAERLRRLGIPTPEICALYRLDRPGMTAVLYAPLPGEVLSNLGRKSGFDWEEVLAPLIDLIRRLHREGVYFRSLHLGNVVRTPDGRMGLIDLADMRFLRGPLSTWMARRNLAHFRRYLRREQLASSFPLARLEAALFQSASPSKSR